MEARRKDIIPHCLIGGQDLAVQGQELHSLLVIKIIKEILQSGRRYQENVRAPQNNGILDFETPLRNARFLTRCPYKDEQTQPCVTKMTFESRIHGICYFQKPL